MKPFGIFWTCFRQGLDLNFQSPSFSAVFPPFSAVFCPFLFLWCFLLYSLPLPFGKMPQMPDCNKQFQWDSILWGNDSLTDRFSHEAMTPVLGVVTLLKFEIGFTKAFRSQALKWKQLPLSFTHPRTIQNREKGKTRMTTKKSPQKTRNASAKQNMHWRRRRPSEAFFSRYSHFINWYHQFWRLTVVKSIDIQTTSLI